MANTDQSDSTSFLLGTF